MNKFIFHKFIQTSSRFCRNNPNRYFLRTIINFNKLKLNNCIFRDIPVIILLVFIISLGINYEIISLFLFFSIVLYLAVLLIFFYLLPSLFITPRGKGIFDHCLQLILLSHLHFIKESYVTGFTGQRKIFTFFSLFVGMIFSRVFGVHCFILFYFSLLFINTCILLYGSNENSFIWKFYVNTLGV